MNCTVQPTPQTRRQKGKAKKVRAKVKVKTGREAIPVTTKTTKTSPREKSATTVAN